MIRTTTCEPQQRRRLNTRILGIRQHFFKIGGVLFGNIDQLVRRAFSLYTSQMLTSISDETYKQTFEPTIKQVSKEVEKTKKMLLALVDKKDKKYFEGWWWQLTVGLELDTEPYPNPKTDVRWTGKKI